MKNNSKKGFMMAEVVIVSAIILTAITMLFMNYNKIFMAYRKRISYYDITTLHRTAYYRDILIENNIFNDILSDAKKQRNHIKQLYNSYSNKGESSIFSLNNDNETIPKNEGSVSILIYNGKRKNLDISYFPNDLHVTFKDYAKYISESADLSDTDYVILTERCELKNSKNIDNCKYAYLKIYSGLENQ